MDIEKLYQDVWAQVFAESWMRYDLARATGLANAAAKEAVEVWSTNRAHDDIARAGVEKRKAGDS